MKVTTIDQFLEKRKEIQGLEKELETELGKGNLDRVAELYYKVKHERIALETSPYALKEGKFVQVKNNYGYEQKKLYFSKWHKWE